jgi:CRP-like cAMP-binding protein
MVSKLIVFEDGTQIESALVGREGAVGAIAVLGLRTALTRDVCHLAGRAAVLDASSLLAAYQQSQRIHDAFHRYCAWKMSCAIRNGACNAQHSVEQRLGRWLLTCSDVLEESEIRLSQEVFAHMLGVQRSSVNTILQKFRSEGLICLERARLKIVDHRRLQAQACECYGAMKAAEDQLLGLHPPIRSA